MRQLVLHPHIFWNHFIELSILITSVHEFHYCFCQIGPLFLGRLSSFDIIKDSHDFSSLKWLWIVSENPIHLGSSETIQHCFWLKSQWAVSGDVHEFYKIGFLRNKIQFWYQSSKSNPDQLVVWNNFCKLLKTKLYVFTVTWIVLFSIS